MDYEEQVKEVVATATFGDLIEFSYPIGYSHWGVYDEQGYIIHFAVSEEGEIMSRIRGTLEGWFPYCGDLLLGQTRIRRVPLGEVKVPKGAHVLISNTRHSFIPSDAVAMRRRCDALINQDFKYDLFYLNCEHFATFVRYGKAVCNQIPTKLKNEECVKATNVFEAAVSAADPAQKECSILF